MDNDWYWACGKAVDQADEALKAFHEAFRVLPRVASDGSSECPFAEQLYRQCNEKDYFVRQRANELDDLQDAAPEAIQQQREVLDEIDADDDDGEARRLNAQAIVDSYQKMAQTVAKTLSLLRTALNQACTKRYPGMARLTDEDFQNRPR